MIGWLDYYNVPNEPYEQRQLRFMETREKEMSDETINTALAKAQSAMKAAVINRVNPHFKNKYADLAAVIDAVRKPFADNGLSFTHTMHPFEGNLSLVCTLRHVSGEYIISTYPLPANAKPQELGSALTYGRRYTLSAIAGIAADEDDDAELASKRNGATTVDKKPTPISPQQIQAMADLMESVGADVQGFLDYAGVSKLADVDTANYGDLMEALQEKGKRGQK